MENMQINRAALIEKFPGKGGWSYILITEISPDFRDHFGQVKVSGAIDHYLLENATLMPYGNGKFFLPLNANIRKQLQKEAGDSVQLKIYLSRSSKMNESNLIEILADEPSALSFYKHLPENEKSHYLKWINDTQNEETQVERIAKVVNDLYERSRYEKPVKV